MGTVKFCIEGDRMTELESGMSLLLVDEENLSDDKPWINGWFQTADNKLVIQHFVVLPVGSPSYALAGKAIDHWGREQLGVEQASAAQMSGSFGSQLLLPAVVQFYY